MLVLSRRQNEKITIGDDIVITVVSIKGESVRLGITAPVTIPIHRDDHRPFPKLPAPNERAEAIPLVDSKSISNCPQR